MFDYQMKGKDKELNTLFSKTNSESNFVRNQIVELQKENYTNRYKIEKLEEINSKGQKQKDEKWKQENFLKHFYASYLLASIQLADRTCEESKHKHKEFTIYLDYKLKPTPFLGIASQRLIEISNKC